MGKEKSLQDHSFFKENQEALFQQWLTEVEENPHFSKAAFKTLENLEASSQDFLSKLVGLVESPAIPDFSDTALEPLFKLLHNIRQEHLQKGLSSKDTAMLIFSFKATLINFMKSFYKKKSFTYSKQLNKMNNLLDFLGLITFEIYTAEKENVIGRQHEQIHYLQNKQSGEKFGSLIGSSLEMSRVYKAVGLILDNDITVLLEGESGTGKDMVANVIHSNSNRKEGPFVTVNCGAIPKELIESELFGHEKGSFTGALERRIGKFELADGGTLFLDEIGELDLSLQVKLLRVLQDHKIERVGGRDKLEVNVRIIAATNRDLKEAVQNKTFRLDLYYRLNVFPISIPPLRDRQSDILPLANYFLKNEWS